MGLTGSASAEVLFQESFDYDEGTLDGQGGWVAAGTSMNVASPGLSYPGLVSSGNAAAGPGGGGFNDKTDLAISPFFSTFGTYYLTGLINFTANGWVSFSPNRDAGGAPLLHRVTGAGRPI